MSADKKRPTGISILKQKRGERRETRASPYIPRLLPKSGRLGGRRTHRGQFFSQTREQSKLATVCCSRLTERVLDVLDPVEG